MAGKRSAIPWLKVRDGVYYVYWYAGAEEKHRTKRLSLGTTDAVEAQQRYASFLAKGHASFGPGGTAGITCSLALDDYWREHVLPNVVDRRRAENAVRHLKAWFGNTLLKDVDIPASRAYADARRMGAIGGGARRKVKEGADATIRRELVVLNAAANHAARWKRIGPKCEPPTTMPSIELPSEAPVEQVSEADYLTKEEWARAVGAATGWLHDFMVIAYDSGSRRAAIESLTKFQVDLAQGRVNLRSPTETVNQRRSRKRRTVVPIGADARPVYERLMATGPKDGFLFGVRRDAYRFFREHMEAIGLGHKRNPHIIRHTRATHLLQAGVPIYDVARLLGDTVATVERVYGHHSPEYLSETLNRANLRK